VRIAGVADYPSEFEGDAHYPAVLILLDHAMVPEASAEKDASLNEEGLLEKDRRSEPGYL